MKSIVGTYSITSFTLISILIGSVFYELYSSTNEVDEAGLRQGYWVVYGHMSKENGYAESDVVEEGVYADDLKIGVWKRYYPSGKLKSEITFENNRPIGKYTLYYENGVIEEQGNWQKSKNIGEFKRNYENGEPHQEFVFSDSGKRNGLQVYYHSNGNIALEVKLVNGKETGIMKRYDEDGNLTEEKTFSDGTYRKGSTIRHNETKEEYIPKPADVQLDSGVEAETSEPNKAEETNAAHHFQANGHNILYNKDKQVTQSLQ